MPQPPSPPDDFRERLQWIQNVAAKRGERPCHFASPSDTCSGCAKAKALWRCSNPKVNIPHDVSTLHCLMYCNERVEPGAALQRGHILFLMREQTKNQYYRAGPTRRIAKVLEPAGYTVHQQDIPFKRAKTKALLCSVAEVDRLCSALPEKPLAVMRWEEHSCLLTNQRWREVVTWCYENGIAPMSVDYGYLDHYSTFIFDTYRPDSQSSIIDDWPSVPGLPVQWETAHPGLVAYRDKLEGIKQEALRLGPMDGDEPGRYVVLWPSFSAALARKPFQVKGDKHAWGARICQEIQAQGYVPIIKQSPIGGPNPPNGVKSYRGRDKLENARIALHAHNNLVMSSTVTNEFVMWGVPCTAMGRSWFTGLGVFHEPDAWVDIVEPGPVLHEGRARYLNWWFGREYYMADATAALDERIAAWHGATVPPGGIERPNGVKALSKSLRRAERPCGGCNRGKGTITVLLPTHGRFEALQECVSSFLLQDEDDAVLLIINDAPVPVVVADGVERVRVLNTSWTFTSLGAKLDAALRLVDTPLIAKWDDDDLYLPWALSDCRSFLAKSQRARAVIPDWTWYMQAGAIVKPAKRGWRDAAMMYDRATALALGGYPHKRRGSGIKLCKKFDKRGLLLWGAREMWRGALLRRWDMDDKRLTSTATQEDFYARNTDYGAAPLMPVSLREQGGAFLTAVEAHVGEHVTEIRKGMESWLR